MRKVIFIMVIIVSIGISGCGKPPPSDFTVKNKSDLEIQELRVTVDGQAFTAENIKPKEERMFQFFARRDSSYNVKVKFTDGHVLEENCGYVTHGMIFHDVINIDANEITLTREEVDIDQ